MDKLRYSAKKVAMEKNQNIFKGNVITQSSDYHFSWCC